MDSVKESVRNFLAGLCDVSVLTDSDDIFAGGFVNSLYLVQLLDYLQTEAGIELDEDDFDMDNFRSLNAIEAFVNKKREG